MAERGRKATGKGHAIPALFGRMVRMYRDRRGLTQAALARLAGFEHAQAIAMIERGKALPSLERAADLAAALHVTVDELLGGRSPAHVVHHHTPGEVRVWVSNPGLVVLGNYGPADIDRLMERWQHWRGTTQGRHDAAEPGFPSVEDALGDAPLAEP